jgi:hypothetical protein
VTHRGPVGMQRPLFECALRIDYRLERFVLDPDPFGGTARLLRMLCGDERNRLPEVAHPLVGEHGLVGELEPVALGAWDVVMRQDGMHAGHPDRLGDVDRDDARVRGIDISAAVGMAGVHAVLTHEDVPGQKTYGLEFADQPVLAIDRVRYYGEAVALVAAEHPEQARRAAEKIVV